MFLIFFDLWIIKNVVDDLVNISRKDVLFHSGGSEHQNILLTTTLKIIKTSELDLLNKNLQNDLA